MKFRINRKKWRCGLNSINKKGEGPTLLLNSQGYMCCLGQICKQLKTPNIIGCHCPVQLRTKVLTLTKKDEDGYWENTELAKSAMNINDDDTINNETREKELISLFSKWKHKVEFYN